MTSPNIDSMQASVVLDCRQCLGESPVWDARTATLYWANIHDAQVWAWDPSGTAAPRCYPLPERVGAIGLREAGGLVIALASAFALLDLDSGALARIADVPSPAPHTRLNDGRVDPAGRFVCGGMNEQTPQLPNARVYTLERDHRVSATLDGIHCANSTCWSPDGATLYFSDMATRRIDAFDYDVATGAISGRRPFATMQSAGAPDGSVVDAQGYLWNAQWGGAKVVRYRPDGTIDREIALPVSHPTCVAFGGPDLDTLYITTAWFLLDDATRAREPHAGSLFAIKPGVRGLSEARYAG
ncbi:SMP-30/gluconolactonase/LRE family protein [Pararobbsia silviterrae]|uniref:SMP-30/gluconolactonase/LRE family protein n=1 Tax=Pararobbsia silviterrae TaxID=1792498 RepID=A0A494Y817_9BURK|nr:SMP-30/gluconolactonase/LRE family protein [Pararobbsia silviterrae]RKP57707.1 SMP-30/gluconolactonase/LRE family protein [Pararobbsia silviterrae]